MREKVKCITDTFFNLSRGNQESAALLLSNFVSQRAVKPFVFESNETDITRFGNNVRDTLLAAKNLSKGTHQRGVSNLLRQVIASGAQGPLSQSQVWIFAALLLFWGTTNNTITRLCLPPDVVG